MAQAKVFDTSVSKFGSGTAGKASPERRHQTLLGLITTPLSIEHWRLVQQTLRKDEPLPLLRAQVKLDQQIDGEPLK